MGTVFLLSPPRGLFGWSITILYSFRGTDGGYPYDGLTLDAGNNLYGATRYGGSHSCGAFSCGAVFKLSPPVLARTQWTETVLHDFDGTDGFMPNGDLLLDASTGALFGTTIQGGLYNGGTVYTLTPPANGGSSWNFETLWQFNAAEAPAHISGPNGGLAGATGALFGTTGLGPYCCGAVFLLSQEFAGSQQYTFKVLHQFGSGGDGAAPLAGLLEDASRDLWGTTAEGGAYGFGTVFKLAADPRYPMVWDYSVAYSFRGGAADGASPGSPLTADSTGSLYGTSAGGGTGNSGTVYKVIP